MGTIWTAMTLQCVAGDPFTQHSNEAIWAALEESQLAPWVRERGGAEERGKLHSGSLDDSSKI